MVAYFDIICISGVTVLLITLLSFWRGFCWRNVWPSSFAVIVYCTTLVDRWEDIILHFYWQCDGFGTWFGDCQRRRRSNSSVRGSVDEIGASYGKICVPEWFRVQASFCSIDNDMPLLRRQPFVRARPPPDIKPDDYVFYCRVSGEVFTDYE